MNELLGNGGVVRATIEITRAATGKKETVQVTGYVRAGQFEDAENKENNDGDHSLDGRAQRSD